MFLIAKLSVPASDLMQGHRLEFSVERCHCRKLLNAYPPTATVVLELGDIAKVIKLHRFSVI
jgi:hypothetical protein